MPERPAGTVSLRDLLLAVAVATVSLGLLLSARRWPATGPAGLAALTLGGPWIVAGVLACRDERRQVLWPRSGRFALGLSLFPTVWILLYACDGKIRRLYRPAPGDYAGGPWVVMSLVCVCLILAVLSLRQTRRRSAWDWLPMLVALSQGVLVCGYETLTWESR